MKRKRYVEQDTRTGHERWLVSYADFITLLFGFFVVMYSVSQVSDQKYRVLSETLASIFDGNVPIDAQVKELMDQYPLDNKGQISGLSPVINEVDTEVLAKDLAESLVHMVKSGDVSILAMEDSVEINMNANALFKSGSATPSIGAEKTFRQVAEHLKPTDYKVEVAGHTDNVPIKTAKFASNWELSSARATAIVGLLANSGVTPSNLKSAGFGEYQPVADNATEEGRGQNRRVVLTVTKPVKPAPEETIAKGVSPPLAKSGTETDKLLKTDNVPKTEVPAVRLKNGGLLFTSDPELPRD